VRLLFNVFQDLNKAGFHVHEKAPRVERHNLHPLSVSRADISLVPTTVSLVCALFGMRGSSIISHPIFGLLRSNMQNARDSLHLRRFSTNVTS
jgi:hypothetical protein